jgi:hypothetical protein
MRRKMKKGDESEWLVGKKQVAACFRSSCSATKEDGENQ